ncbi:MAG: hypothetical protein ABI406_02440, partial [Ktedonobacteraceae bacterium]
MSSNTVDCSAIEERINEHNLYISTTQDQLNKLEQDDPDIQNKRDALNRKLSNLHEQADALQQTLADAGRGKQSISLRLIVSQKVAQHNKGYSFPLNKK